MTTAILTDPRYLAHDDPQHLERAARLEAIYAAMDEAGLNEHLTRLEAREATRDELLAVHTAEHLERIERFGSYGGGYLDPDTYMNTASWDAALWAAGGACRMVEAVLGGECDNGFALVRPPGHHATPSRAMGFCLINNIAVAARHAIQKFGLERVAIIDYDVHHGNGTQDAFYDDPQVLFCSTHASPFYPGTGLLGEIGSGQGRGTTLNVPLPPGVGDTGYAQVFAEIVIPALKRWQPQMILLSAGYDAHWRDYIGPMVVSVDGFAQLTQMVYDCAADVCDGNLALMLEGGYNLEALGQSVVAATRVLLGMPKEPDPLPLGTMTRDEPDISAVLTRLKQHPVLTGQP
jgi:acetoin utilization deacetylase AcuC-like enzyme